jgi:hypothetical protein
MRLKEFVLLEKRLSQVLEDFVVKGQLLILNPLEHTLKGFHFDGSDFDKKSFYVTAFFMPLYVPAEEIHFTFGRRIRDQGGDRWDMQMPHFESILENVMQEEAKFLRKLRTPQDVARALEPLTKLNSIGYVNPHCYEALAYTLAKAGDTAGALTVIDTLLSCVNPAVVWEAKISSRARLIGTALEENPQVAYAQLATWTTENIKNLRLGSIGLDRPAE